ncbi:MAG: DUF814 domain-containing protein [Candidatus Krumholzibacteriota bacterium]|nr:DUF814 domain-containing protein [Candidatus Krumholzibacteriota bacterium]
MDFPNLLLAAPLFDRLQGLRLERVTWNGPVAVLVFSAHRGRENLVIHLHQEVQGFHLDTTLREEFEHIQFQDGRHDFSFLPPHLEGATFLGAAPLKGQSLLRLDFTSSGNFKENIPLFLYVEFFAGGRLVLADRDNRVIRASRKGGELHRPGAHYWPAEADLAQFGQELPLEPSFFEDWPEPLLGRVRRGGEETLDDAIYRGLKGFQPASARYLVERPRRHDRYRPEAVLAHRLSTWLDRVLHHRQPVTVLGFAPETTRRCEIFAFPLEGPYWTERKAGALDVSHFEDYVMALNFMGSSCLARVQMTELMGTLRRVVGQRLEHNQRLVSKLESDWERAAGSGERRRQADTLASHMGEVRRGMQEIDLDDVHDQDARLQIPLDPALSPQENLNRLYQQAAKGERGLKTIELRLEEVRARIFSDEAVLREKLPALARCYARNPREIAVLREALLELAEEASLLRPRPRAEIGPRREIKTLFRRHVLPGDWLVLVGRNNRENDLLTHREAAPHDLWFHAAGVSGSHIILKTGGHKSGPPRTVLEAAAAIAAFFSKARHSSLVPVIYTEKRYVRKPRKGAPGLALCTRERTLFVKPAALGVSPRQP